MLLLTVSHPYTSIEIIAIVLSWSALEYFYFKNPSFKKKDVAFPFIAFILYFAYYSILLKRIEIYRQIDVLNSLDWGYKAWHFIPAYAIVWFFSFLCIRNIPLLKTHFADSNNRLFFCWGAVAFLLSVHGFAFKPVQPIHFTRGYVYAGFFLFCLPTLQIFIKKHLQNKTRGYLGIAIFLFIFLFDNITWFGLPAFQENSTGVYFTKEEKEVIDFFKQQKEFGIAIGSDRNYELNSVIQLFSVYKAWIPHPFLTFEIDKKRKAKDSLLINNQQDEQWKNQQVYLYCDKNKDSMPRNHLPIVFENSRFKIFKVN